MRIGKLFAVLMTAVLLLCGCGINSAGAPAPESLPPLEEAKGELTVYCFSAGKADAHLIYDGSFAVLIDCGEKGFGKEIVGYLENAGITKLDMLILTHFDKDHIGGAAKVLKSLEVGEVIQSNCPKDSSEYADYTEQLRKSGIVPTTLRERITRTFGAAQITLDPPASERYPTEPSNNSSLITTVRFGECSLLFTGDAEDMRLAEYLKSAPGGCDFLKVPYHGHWQDRTAELLRRVSPAVAVITSSDSEPEDARVTSALRELGAAVYLTREAPVTVKCNGKTVSAYYDG